MIRALGNANPSHLLDRNLFDFKGLGDAMKRGMDPNDDNATNRRSGEL